MEEFFKFLKQNRPDVGLVDRFDLSEIYDSDERFALSNLLLNPDGLDQIYKLSSGGLTKEDVRTMGDLNNPVVHSLAISSLTLGSIKFALSSYVTTDKAIGEPGKHSFNVNAESDNVVVFHGGLAAKKIEYNFLDENGSVRTTTVPTSRESLFNSEKNANGEYTLASYPGLFRIRRRSHINELKLAPKLLITKGSIIESPTDTLKIPVYMRTSTNTSPAVTNLECYATKNSPLILPVKIYGSATISFSRTGANSSSPAFVFGWELKRKSDLTTARSATISSSGAINDVSITINTTGTVCNGVDSLLYVYLDPTVIVRATLANIGMTEEAGRDIGLVGFDSLEELDISSNGLSTLPVWLKTLHNKLKKLKIRGNNFWNNGIVSYFDWQEPPTGIDGASSGDGTPYLTLTQVLGYSGFTNSGAITGYDGTLAKIQDSAGVLYKNQRNIAINGGTAPTVDIANGFRPFTLLEELDVGPSVRMANADFFTLFPNLKTFVADTGDGSPRVMFGLIPRFKNNGALMSVNMTWHAGNVGGSIRYLGTTKTWNDSDSSATKQQFIGQFKFSSFNINNSGGGGWYGGICTTDDDVGSVVPSTTINGLPKYSFVAAGSSASSAWSGWLAEIQYLGVYYRDIAVRIAVANNLNWLKLGNINCNFCGVWETSNKVQYNASVASGTETATDILNASQLSTIESYFAGWYGKMFSISNAPSLSYWNAGANNWSGYIASTGEEYLLPSNFANENHNLQTIYLHYIFNSWSRNLEFRQTDLRNLPKISIFYLGDSYFTGKFPTIYTNSQTSGVTFNTWFHNCRFRDLSALGSSQTSRVGSIYGPSNGTGVGGSLLPNFKTTSNNSTLSYVNLDGTLSSRYPSNWYVAENRGRLIAPLVTGSTEENTPSVTWTSKVYNGSGGAVSSDKLFQSGGLQIDSQVMVGDIVYNGSTEIGRVTQIDRNNSFIHIDAPAFVNGASLKFRRAGQNISEFFDRHTSLDQVYLQVVKITGTVPLFTSCTNLRFVYFTENLLTTYQSGTLKNITGMSTGASSTPGLRRFYLEKNPLTKQSIKNIINEVHEIAVYFRARNINPNFIVGLYATKYDSTNKEYQNWTRAEIFDQSSTYTNAAGETITEPDPLETKFNQLGTGNTYSGISIQLF